MTIKGICIKFGNAFLSSKILYIGSPQPYCEIVLS